MSARPDLILINPGASSQMYGQLGSTLAAIEPPLWCIMPAAFVREHGFSVSVIDAEAENLSPEQTAERVAQADPLLAAIVVMGSNPSAASTPKMTAAGDLARELARSAPDVKRLMMGLHPSALPERTLREEAVDYVVRGEGFYTLLHLLEAMKEGRTDFGTSVPGLCHLDGDTFVASPPPPLVDADALPMSAWDLVPMDRYRAHNWHCFGIPEKRQPYGVMYTSLGCPFNCTYCNIRAVYNEKPGIRYRSPEKVIEEIDLLVQRYGIRSLKIADELFALDEERVVRICDMLIERGYGLNIWAYGRVNTVSEPMLRKMKQAGINWVCYGFESASELVRSGVTKKTTEENTRRAIEMTKRAGIYIMANFMFGLPDDDEATMQATLDMAKSYNFEYVNFYSVMAYPGSELYDDAVAHGIPLPETWNGYGQYSYETLPLPTRHLSAAEVLRFRDRAFNEYMSNPAYQSMVAEKFGEETVAHIKDMLKHHIKRKYA